MAATEDWKLLASGLHALELQASHEALEALLAYRDLLARWNRVHNLTAVRDPKAMIVHHLLDSLSINSFLHGQSLLDMGSGAGLPGVPLALVNPKRCFTLLDANGKRVRFLRQVATEIGLENVAIVHDRVENFRPARFFDTIVSRAFASLGRFTSAAKPLLESTGHILAMKGRMSEDEVAEVPPDLFVQKVHKLQVPGLEGERHLIDLVFAPGGEAHSTKRFDE